jgi:ribosomal protein S18 acetylase RimI-like enzyme
MSRVALDTMAFNTGAIAFYERLGFKMFKHTMDLQLEDGV